MNVPDQATFSGNYYLIPASGKGFPDDRLRAPESIGGSGVNEVYSCVKGRMNGVY